MLNHLSIPVGRDLTIAELTNYLETVEKHLQGGRRWMTDDDLCKAAGEIDDLLASLKTGIVEGHSPKIVFNFS